MEKERPSKGGGRAFKVKRRHEMTLTWEGRSLVLRTKHQHHWNLVYNGQKETFEVDRA